MSRGAIPTTGRRTIPTTEPGAIAAVVTSFLIGANVQLGITPATFSVAGAAHQIVALLLPAVPRRAKPR